MPPFTVSRPESADNVVKHTEQPADVPRDEGTPMKQPIERRSGQDRRQEDLGFPGKVERRRRIEQRKVEIVELSLSEAEWQQLVAIARASAPPPPPPFREEQADRIFERAGSRSCG